jgi:hypothetical protein
MRIVNDCWIGKWVEESWKGLYWQVHGGSKKNTRIESNSYFQKAEIHNRKFWSLPLKRLWRESQLCNHQADSKVRLVITKFTFPSYLNDDSSFMKHTVTYARVCFSDKTNRLSAHSWSTSTTLLLVVTPHLRQSEKPGVSTHLRAERTSGATPAAWATGVTWVFPCSR